MVGPVDTGALMVVQRRVIVSAAVPQGVRWGGEACAEAQPVVGGGSRRPRWRWFGFGGWRKR